MSANSQKVHEYYCANWRIIENIESKGFKIYNSVDSSFYVKDGITIFVDDANSNFKIAEQCVHKKKLPF